MKKLLNTGLAALAITLFTIYACKPVEEISVQKINGWGKMRSKSEIYSFKQELYTPKNTATFKIDSGSKKVFAEIKFPDNFAIAVPLGGWYYVDNNSPVKKGGVITVEEIYLNNLGATIRNTRPTITGDQILETSGSFYQRYSIGSREVRNDGYMYFKLPNGANNPKDEIFFDRNDTNPLAEVNKWDRAVDSISGYISQNKDTVVTSTGISTYFTDSCFRTLCKYYWINCDHFYNCGCTLTSYRLNTPLQFGNVNTKAYIVFLKDSSVCELNTDTGKKIFLNYDAYKAPLGAKVRFITETKSYDKYYLGVLDTILSADTSYNIIPKETSLNGIIEYLKTF